MVGRFLKRARAFFVNFLQVRTLRNSGVEVPYRSKISGSVSVGYGTNINGPCRILSKAGAKVNIGRYCAIGHNFGVRSRNHKTRYLNMQDSLQERLSAPSLDDTKGDITIGHNVWIGDSVIVLPGVTVGNGAVIGAGAVVTKNVERYTIVAGVPARRISARCSDAVAERIEQLAWWEWPVEVMERYPMLFSCDLRDESSALGVLAEVEASR